MHLRARATRQKIQDTFCSISASWTRTQSEQPGKSVRLLLRRGALVDIITRVNNIKKPPRIGAMEPLRDREIGGMTHNAGPHNQGQKWSIQTDRCARQWEHGDCLCE